MDKLKTSKTMAKWSLSSKNRCSKDCCDVCFRHECDDNFEDNGRKKYIYLMVVPVHSDLLSNWIVKYAEKKKRSEISRGSCKRDLAKSARSMHVHLPQKVQ